MGVNGVYGPFNTDQKIKLQNRGANSGITFELKSVFDQMAKDGLIKDTDGKGLTKTDAQNMYEDLNKMHQETGRATNYTKMQVGQEFTYTADEMKALAQAAGYEVVEQAPLEEDIVTEEELNQDEVVQQEEVTPQEEPPLQDDPGEILEPETPQEKLVTGPKEGENPEYDKAVKGDDGVEDPSTKPEKEPVNNEDKSMRELRKEAREQNRLERREDRIERKEARQAGRELRKNLRETEADFAANGQVGKIVDGKYYINGKETTKENYEMAKIKSDALDLTQSKNEEIKAPEEKSFNVNSELKGLTKTRFSSQFTQMADGKHRLITYDDYSNADGKLIAREAPSKYQGVKVINFVEDQGTIITKSTMNVDDLEQSLSIAPKSMNVLQGMKQGFYYSPFSDVKMNITSTELLDSNGKLVAKYENGEFVNSDGKKISENKLTQYIDNNSGLTMVANYAKPEALNKTESQTISPEHILEKKLISKADSLNYSISDDGKFNCNNIPKNSFQEDGTVASDIYKKIGIYEEKDSDGVYTFTFMDEYIKSYSYSSGDAFLVDKIKLAQTMGAKHAVYVDLHNKVQEGTPLTNGEKIFMENFEKEYAKCCYYMDLKD